jgi:hypothetical protein
MVRISAGKIYYVSVFSGLDETWVVGLAPVQDHQPVRISAQVPEVGNPIIGSFYWPSYRRSGDNQDSGPLFTRSPHNPPVHVFAAPAEFFTAYQGNSSGHI